MTARQVGESILSAVGLGLVATGIWLVSIPAALIVLGLLLLLATAFSARR